jgi:mannose-6-phosphate isomerase-like protein (cupin superfamily)
MAAPFEGMVQKARVPTTFTDAWQPRTVALFNGHDVMVAKLCGEYRWHVHDNTDDFFLVLDGRLEIDL